MPLKYASKPVWWGTEWYQVTLEYTGPEADDVVKLAKPGKIVTDTVHLVWRREAGKGWERYTNGIDGSRAEGRTRLDDDTEAMGARGPRKTMEIFTREHGELKHWTVALPCLRAAVEDAEAYLPG